MRIGVNTFNVKNLFPDDFQGTLKKLKDIGFTSLEVCVTFQEDNQNLKDIPEETLELIQLMRGGIWSKEEAEERFPLVRAAGLEIDSIHAGLDCSSPEALLKNLPLLESFAEKNHIKYIVTGFPKNLEELKVLAPVLNQMAEALQRKGVVFAYHNHAEECKKTDGVSIIEYLLDNCPCLMAEPDVGWMHYAGMSPVSFMEKYAKRIVLLHLKDVRFIAEENNRKPIFTAVGAGCVPMEEVLKLTDKCNLAVNGLIIDQDDSQGDILTDLAYGVEFVLQFRG